MKTQDIHSKVDGYIQTVITDACLSENKPNDVEYQFSVIGDVVVFAMMTKFKRVENKVMYRLQNNISKNFKLKFNEDFRIFNGIDPNYSVMRWDLFGEFATLQAFGDKTHLLPKHYENDNLEFFISQNYENSAAGWDAYMSDFEKVYGRKLASELNKEIS